MRLKATELCHSIAARFRDRRHHVLLLVDSLTRYAMARREIALSLGEPPATKGYPPSAFGMIPKLVERRQQQPCGIDDRYLHRAGGRRRPARSIVDCARAVLDGHIVLTRKLAEAGRIRPLISGQSISRCMNQVTSPEHQQSARALKQNYAAYMEIKPLDPLGGCSSRCRRQRRQSCENVPGYPSDFCAGRCANPPPLELVQNRLQKSLSGVKKAEQ